MNRLLIGLSAISLAGIVLISGTLAFYNDVESTQGNVMVAGDLDLTVDNSSYYNGYVCEDGIWQCEPWADIVYSFTQGTKKNGQPVPSDRSNPSKALGEAERNDTLNFVSLGLGINGEIVLEFDNLILNGEGGDIEIVETSFGSPSCSSYPERARVFVSQDAVVWDDLGDICLDAFLDLDAGSLQLPWAKYVKLVDITDAGSFNNEADGYDLDGIRAIHCGSLRQDIEGESCQGTWDLKDLENEKFFNFTDIKPGDKGKDVISLHVQGNESWVCATIENMLNNDNSCVEPEEDADETCGEDFDPNGGELAQNLYFFAWNDDGNGFFEPDEGEFPLFSNIAGPAIDVLNGVTYSIADSETGTGDPFAPNTAQYIGISWCAGNMAVDQYTGSISCDAAGMGNDCQSDSMSADIIFYAYQARHNEDFVCAPPPECKQTEGCMTFEYLPSYDGETYRFKITNNCDRALSHAAFELPEGEVADSPLDGDGNYIGLHNTYDIENTTNNPFYSIKFETIGEGIKNGEFEIFEYVMPEGTTMMDYLRIQTKAAGEAYQLTFNISECTF